MFMLDVNTILRTNINSNAISLKPIAIQAIGIGSEVLIQMLIKIYVYFYLKLKFMLIVLIFMDAFYFNSIHVNILKNNLKVIKVNEICDIQIKFIYVLSI